MPFSIEGIIEEERRRPQGKEIFTTTELPRKNKKLKTFLQPDFSIDVLEEPAAEPVSTFGVGWVPLSVEQVIGQLFVYNFLFKLLLFQLFVYFLTCIKIYSFFIIAKCL